MKKKHHTQIPKHILRKATVEFKNISIYQMLLKITDGLRHFDEQNAKFAVISCFPNVSLVNAVRIVYAKWGLQNTTKCHFYFPLPRRSIADVPRDKTDCHIWASKPIYRLTHIEAETKWPPFRRRHFQMHFPEWKYLNFDSNFTEICS